MQVVGCYSFKLPESGVMGMHRVVQNIEAVRTVSQEQFRRMGLADVNPTPPQPPCHVLHLPALSWSDRASHAAVRAHSTSHVHACARKQADVVVCITGTDGGMASVVAGMVETPVLALPTSAGYGEPP